MTINFKGISSTANARPRSFMGMLGVISNSNSNTCDNIKFGRSGRIPPLERLLRRGDFPTIIQLLKDPNANLDRWFDSEYNFVGENALHLIMRYGPPAELVTCLIARLKESGVSSQPEVTVDHRGRTPLHLACESHCEPAVIHALLETSAGALSARSKDLDGRLPLHLLCRGCKLPRIRKPKDAQQGRVVALRAVATNITLLVGLSPRTACVPDYKHNTALDYIQNVKIEKEDEVCREIWEAMKQELTIAMDLSLTTATIQNTHQAGMVIKFNTECTDVDNVSVLSCPCGT
ncbi:ankyrin repeat domain protein [Nitzschia inconspicua]|uniref:Ankyrin repeat domain protein n=1 Tax=Nitzschia inconspicua TaxID=303405 RepID=A0A9K3L7Z2_9STRA|nr:ankyrin repeat domain protein [Nitzschia inconspicua]